MVLSILSTVYSVRNTVYSTQCTLYYTVYTIQCTLHSVQCTGYLTGHKAVAGQEANPIVHLAAGCHLGQGLECRPGGGGQVTGVR